MTIRSPIRRLAIVVGGGPAPGINGVISAVTIEAINRGIEVYGIQDGYEWLVNPDTLKAIDQCISQYGFDQPDKWLFKDGLCNIRRLYINDVTPIYSRGGSILGTSRTNPTKKKEDMDRVLKVFTTMGFDALVSIGGDDTAYTASRVYQSVKDSGGYIRVAHVPKTIDNDLPLPGSTPTFGFETARHHGVSLVRALAEDARTTSRWYIVISMGRNAGHLALGIGKASAATVTIIPEEFGLDENKKPKTITLKHLCDILLGSIIKRYSKHDRFGVIVLAEGLIESVKSELKTILDNTSGKYGTYKTDDHGHLRLGEIEFGKLIRDLLTERLIKPTKLKDGTTPEQRLNDIIGVHGGPYGLDVTFVSKDLGYELRSADPIPFDAEYTRDLGYSAVKFLLEERAEQFGAIIGFIDGGMKPMKFEDMLDKKTNRMQIRLVNVAGEGYEVASRYMIRLDADDFSNPAKLKKLADAIHMDPEAFRRDFAYLI